jgi:hypothetical protein
MKVIWKMEVMKDKVLAGRERGDCGISARTNSKKS